MPQYLDKTGLTTLWTKIKNTFALKSHTHKKSEITDLTIPTVNNPTITINQGGTKKGSFTLNQSGATTINLADNNTTYTAGTGLSLSNGAFSVKTGYTTSGKNYKVTTDSNGNLYVSVPWTDTNTNTWRPVVDNLTSTATDQSLSANQGKVLKSYIDTYFPRAKYGNDSYYSDVSNSFIGGVYNGPRTNDWEFLYRAEHRNGAGDGPNYVMEMVSNLTSDSSIYWRKKTGSSFTSFREIIDSNNIGSQSVKYATTSGSANSVSWGNVSGKPSSFTPASHTHSSVTDIGNSTATTFAYSKSGLNYGDYTWLAGWNGYELRAVNKSQFAKASHTHSKSEVGLGNVDNTADANKNVNYANSAGSVAWGNVTGKPSTYTPSAHDHTSLKSNTDNRNSNTTPNDYNGILNIAGLKGNDKIGLDTNIYGTYSCLIGVRGWGDSSGGNAHELAFTGNGHIAHRHGSTTSWGSWNRIAHVSDIPTKLPASNISMSFSNGVLTITYN